MIHQIWQSYSFKAMGSQMTLWLDTDQETDAAFQTARHLFDSAERRLSRLQDDSELSRLNRRPGQWVDASHLLFDVTRIAIDMARITGGLFDPTQLRALEQAGYTRSFEHLDPAQTQYDLAVPITTGWSSIGLDNTKHRIYLPPYVGLDLGGIAKGYVATMVQEWLRPLGPCLVDAGGDLVAGDAPRGLPGWPVSIAMPASMADQGEDALMLWLKNASLATSGVDYRHWPQGGQPRHHIIDPRSGQPADTDLMTVSVLAANACRAEALATASLVAGKPVKGGIASLLIAQDGKATITQTLIPHMTWCSPALDLTALVA